MSVRLSWLANIAFLTFPIWGVVLYFGLLSVVPGGGKADGTQTVLLGMIVPFVGAVPIFRSTQPAILKAFLFFVYYAVSAVAMFVFGWMSLGLFGFATH
jgi:hypothetical protein